MVSLDELLDRCVPPRPASSPLPVERLAVLTCMDARLAPLADLGLGIGDAHVIRNAGGRATDDALRSLLYSWRLLGTRRVLVLQHTDCGAHVDDVAALAARLGRETGTEVVPELLDAFTDQHAAVAQDVGRIRATPFAPEGLEVRGAIHDLASGRLVRVDAD